MVWPKYVARLLLLNPNETLILARLQVGIDVSTAPRQAGYISDNSSITGISLMHDEGTGGNTNGGYGIFPLFPLMNCNFASCPVGLSARQTLRAAGTDGMCYGLFCEVASRKVDDV